MKKHLIWILMVALAQGCSPKPKKRWSSTKTLQPRPSVSGVKKRQGGRGAQAGLWRGAGGAQSAQVW